MRSSSAPSKVSLTVGKPYATQLRELGVRPGATDTVRLEREGCLVEIVWKH